MRSSPRPRAYAQQLFAAALVAILMFAGVLPALHHHGDETAESHCHDSGSQAPSHYETLENEHHEPCGLCAKSFSSSRLERPLATIVDESVAKLRSDGSQTLPSAPPGRDGASRAPPHA